MRPIRWSARVDLRRWGACLTGCELTKGPVRPGGVVVPQVLGQYLVQVALIDDQQPAGDLAAQGADHPLANGIRPRGSGGGGQIGVGEAGGVCGHGRRSCGDVVDQLGCLRICSAPWRQAAGAVNRGSTLP